MLPLVNAAPGMLLTVGRDPGASTALVHAAPLDGAVRCSTWLLAELQVEVESPRGSQLGSAADNRQRDAAIRDRKGTTASKVS